MFNFCPSCASSSVSFRDGKKFFCPDCGFTYYHNVAAAAACLVSARGKDGERLLLTVRGREPGNGLLDLPGGFIDPGEGVLEGLRRELREELGWTPPVPRDENPDSVFTLFASFPNVYVYKSVTYNTCDLYFSVSAPCLSRKDLRVEKAEISEVLFLKPQEIDFRQFAFDATRRAVKAYLGILD